MKHLVLVDGLLIAALVLALGWLYWDAQPTRLTVAEYTEWMCLANDPPEEMVVPTETLGEMRQWLQRATAYLYSVEPPPEYSEHFEHRRYIQAGMRDFFNEYDAPEAEDTAVVTHAMLEDIRDNPDRYYLPGGQPVGPDCP